MNEKIQAAIDFFLIAWSFIGGAVAQGFQSYKEWSRKKMFLVCFLCGPVVLGLLLFIWLWDYFNKK